jgi:hypothetical protein
MKGFCGIWLVCLLACAMVAQATEVSLIRNGSFEMDGQISNIMAHHPTNWLDVNVPVSKFSGVVNNYWATNGNLSLALSTGIYATFQQGDSAAVAQCVFIGDVNKITFDLQLSTEYPEYNINWDSKLFSAIITIDGNAIWDSNKVGLNQNGVYHIEVNDIDITAGSHSLGIGVRANTAAPTPYYYYYIARWDSIRFVTSGSVKVYPPVDFNRDCIVDLYDLQTFATDWIKPDGLDLNGDAINDFADFAVFGNYWMLGCTEVLVEPTFIDPPQADLNNDGVIDYGDLFVLCEDWLGGGGPCIRSDLNEDGLVDFVDFALFAEHW